MLLPMQHRRAWESFAPEDEIGTGKRNMKELKDRIERYPLLSTHQRRFMEAFISASARVVYGDEYSQETLERDWGYNDTRNVVMVTAARRMGKTYAVQMYALAFLCAIPKCVVAIYAPGMRTANKLMEGITAMYRDIFESEYKIVKCNATEFRISPRGASTDHRVVFCYPSNIVRTPPPPHPTIDALAFVYLYSLGQLHLKET